MFNYGFRPKEGVRQVEKRGPIVLLTDFGLQDHYVGVMKGVIADLAPEAQVIDLLHEIPPQDVLAGAFHLWASYRYFPPGSIFVAVVDPGVGTERKGLLLWTEDRFFLGPDNGLFSLILDGAKEYLAYSLENQAYFLPQVSHTFHGRDIFAPCAAHLFRGVPPEEFGPRVHDLVRLPAPPLREEPHRLVGAVLHVDRFGNLITNIPAEKLKGREIKAVVFRGEKIPFRRTYAEASKGTPLALIDSDGLLEIAVREGSAYERFGREGEVVVEF